MATASSVFVSIQATMQGGMLGTAKTTWSSTFSQTTAGVVPEIQNLTCSTARGGGKNRFFPRRAGQMAFVVPDPTASTRTYHLLNGTADTGVHLRGNFVAVARGLVAGTSGSLNVYTTESGVSFQITVIQV